MKRPAILPLAALLALGPGCTLDVPTAPVAEAVASTAAFSTAAGQSVTFRPISDYLDATRGRCQYSWYNTEVAPADRIWGFVDLTSTYTPTAAYSGFVREQMNSDGTRTVTVKLHGTDVVAWANNASRERVFEASTGGKLHFQLTFSLPAGAPLPNLCDMFSTVASVDFQFSGSGSLREASGFPDGTPGRLTIAQTGRYGLPSQTRGLANGLDDNYPAELVMVKPLLP